MSELKVFQNPEFGTIRTISINGQPFFVGKDVCDILGYSNSRDALAKHVDPEDKGVAKCDTLGYSNGRDALAKHVDPEDKGVTKCDTLGYSNSRDALAKHVDDEDKNTVAIRDGITGNPNQIVVNESGLYSLILSSRLPAARRVRHWVTSEVLPSIRRHVAQEYMGRVRDAERKVETRAYTFGSSIM